MGEGKDFLKKKHFTGFFFKKSTTLYYTWVGKGEDFLKNLQFTGFFKLKNTLNCTWLGEGEDFPNNQQFTGFFLLKTSLLITPGWGKAKAAKKNILAKEKSRI